MEYHVPISRIPLLQDPPFVFWLVLLGAAIGYRLLRLVRAPLATTSALERGVLAAGLGLGLLQYLPFSLGMAGILTPRAVWIGLAASSVLFLPDMVRVLRGAGRALGRVGQNPPAAWLVAGLILLAIPLCVALMQTLTPPIDNDGLAYHLTAPKRWLQGGRMAYLPTLIHTNAPMGVEMLYTLAMAVWSDTAAKLIHFAMGLLTALAIFAVGRRLKSEAVGFTAVALFLLLPRLGTLFLSTTAYVDLGITFETVCAVLAWLLWRRTQASGWLIAAALYAGFAASFKLTGVFVGVTLAGLVLWEQRQRQTALRPALRQAVVFLALSLLPLIPWLWRTALLTGNPVYPFLAGLFPAPDWSREAGAAFDAYFRYYNGGAGQSAWPLAQRQLARTAAMLLVAGAGALAIWRWRDREAGPLAFLASALILFALATTGFYQRFFLPAVPVIVLLVCMGAARPLATKGWARAAVLVFIVVGTAGYLRGANPGLRESVRLAMGRLDRETFLADKLPIVENWRYANANLPLDARILVAAFHPAFNVTGGVSYYCDRTCFATDAYLQRRIRMDTWGHFLSDLRRDRIEYAVVPQEGARDSRIGPDYPPARNELPFALRLARQYGRPLFAAGGVRLYRLERLSEAASLGRS